MHIEILETLIKQNKFEDFKTYYKSQAINSHHKNELLGKCFAHGNYEFIEYMFSKASSSNHIIAPFFIKSIKDPIDKKSLFFFSGLQDKDIIEQIDGISIEKMVEIQSIEIFEWFLHKFPLTSIKNFRNIAYASIRTEKPYLEYFKDFKFDRRTCYNVCLCSFENDQKQTVIDFLKSQLKHTPDIVLEIKNHQIDLFNEYKAQKEAARINFLSYQATMAARALLKPPKKNKGAIVTPVAAPVNIKPKKIPKPELLNDFIQEQTATAFNDYLEEKFPEKEVTSNQNKKNKI